MWTVSNIFLYFRLYSRLSNFRFFSPNKPTPFSAVAGVLRMSSKYMIGPLQEKAIEHLCRIYPTKFVDMESDHKSIRNEVFGSASDAPEHPILLLNLVRSCQVAKLLPWAYYAVVRWSFRDIVAGHTLPDRSVARLSSEDMHTCLLGFETLLTTQHANIKQLFRGPGSKCSSHSSCSDGIAEAYTRALEEHGTGLVAPLGPLRRKVNACDRCVASIKRVDLEQRQEVWNQLPSVFGLPPWNELLKS
ncbi:hypothetical protein JB92DRAFT_2988857 [Gautieria morchelliformis]|nr:hypothetical protein JB92DRAFT_2988857 [Gautieria morchelliformis]